MVLNLIVVAAMLGALGAGVMVVVRAMRRAAPLGPLVCGGCGVFAGDLRDFHCPLCRSDIRERGLVRLYELGSVAIFWRAVRWTAFVSVAGIVATTLLAGHLPTTQYLHSDLELYPSAPADTRAVPGVRIILSGTRSGKGPIRGVLVAEIDQPDGRTAALELSAPQMRVQLADPSGSRFADRWNGRATCTHWLELAGVDPASDQAVRLADRLNWEIHKLLQLDGPDLVQPWGDLRGSNRSASKSGPPAWLVPLGVLLTSAGWLAGLRRALSPRQTAGLTRP